MADEIYEKIAGDIEGQVKLLSASAVAGTYQPQITALQNLIDMLKSSTQSRDISMAALTILQKVGTISKLIQLTLTPVL